MICTRCGGTGYYEHSAYTYECEECTDTGFLVSEIPADWPVQPLHADQPAKDRATCGHCNLSWDDGISTSLTPAPSARCPFEYFHIGEDD